MKNHIKVFHQLETEIPEKRINRLLEKVVSHTLYAVNQIPFYKKRLQGRYQEIKQITSNKEFSQIVSMFSKEDLIKDRAQFPPFGSFVDPNIHYQHLYYAPGPIFQMATDADWDRMVYETATCFYTAGSRPGDIVNNTFNYQWVIAGSITTDGFRRIGSCVVPGGVSNIKTHLEVMHLTNVSILLAFPTFAISLGEAAEEQGLLNSLREHLRLIIFGGEPRSEMERSRIAKLFGVETREAYGTSEFGIIAAECGEGPGMHLSPWKYVEVINPDTGETVETGQAGEIVITDLSRIGMPMIRYRTGDITEGIDTGQCSCGRTSPRLGRIIGRVSDIPRVKGMFVSPRQVTEALQDVLSKDVPFQLIVDRIMGRDRLLVRIGTDAEFSPDIQLSLKENLFTKLRIKSDIERVPIDEIAPNSPIVVDRRIL
jgi:phenylacetate-CoA ligase